MASRGLDTPASDEYLASQSQLVLISFPIVPLVFKFMVLFNPRICLNRIEIVGTTCVRTNIEVRTY
jgi:hypothetical protein